MPKTVKDAIKLKSNAEYLRELRDMTKCPECGVEVDNANGQLEQGVFPLCYSCSEKIRELQRLSDHIAGRC